MPAADATAIYRALHERFGAGDLEGAAALVTDDFELVDMPSGQVFHGPAGLKQWAGAFKTAGPDARTEATNVVAAGEWLVGEHIGRFTHTGPLHSPGGVVPPTGRTVELPMVEVYRLRGDKIAVLRAYYDVATMLRQLGLMPEPMAV